MSIPGEWITWATMPTPSAELRNVRETAHTYPLPSTISEALGHDRASCPECSAADRGDAKP